MENYFYKCEDCSFVYVVPAYWVSFNPEETMEMLHVHPETQQECVNKVLKLVKENA